MHEFRTGQLSGIPLHGPDAFEKAARRIGKQKLFSGSIDHEFICFRNEPLGRNQWTRDVNELIKTMAREEGALLVDVNKAFTDKGGDLSRFYIDDVHPNREGNTIIADAFFQAIAFGRSAPPATSAPFRP